MRSLSTTNVGRSCPVSCASPPTRLAISAPRAFIFSASAGTYGVRLVGAGPVGGRWVGGGRLGGVSLFWVRVLLFGVAGLRACWLARKHPPGCPRDCATL